MSSIAARDKVLLHVIFCRRRKGESKFCGSFASCCSTAHRCDGDGAHSGLSVRNVII